MSYLDYRIKLPPADRDPDGTMLNYQLGVIRRLKELNSTWQQLAEGLKLPLSLYFGTGSRHIGQLKQPDVRRIDRVLDRGYDDLVSLGLTMPPEDRAQILQMAMR